MATIHNSPIVDTASVAKALGTLFEPGMCFELRALNASFMRDRPRRDTISGYFDDVSIAAENVGRIQQASGIYVTLNPVIDALMARSFNRLQVAEKGTLTSDQQITRRRWLPIDIDPQRPSGISSTQSELDASQEIARKIAGDMTNDGWPCPLIACSGNGWHVLYRIDEPIDDNGLIKRVIERMSTLYSVGACHVDEKVFNPARIWKLYGTLARKGDNTEDRPHRWSAIVDDPSDTLVTHEQLVAFAGEVKAKPQIPTSKQTGQQQLESFNVEAFIDRNRLEVDGPYDWHGAQGHGRKWIFRQSPMCDHHGDGPHILQHASGAVSASCHHNSCSWSWRDLRNTVEPLKPLRDIYNATPIDVLAETEPFPGDDDFHVIESPVKQETKTETKANKHVVPTITLMDALNAKLEKVRAGEEKLYTTGLPGVDIALSGGVAPGEVIIIAARPSHGKSALALQMIHHMSAAGRKCLIISEEMTTDMLAGRALAYISDVPKTQWRDNLSQVVRQVSEYGSARSDTLVATGCNTVQRATETIRHAVNENGVDTVFVDYLQLLSGGKKSNYENVSYASQQIQKLTIELGVVSVVMAQLNRDIESREKFIPKMRDLRDSGQIEQDAHVILFGAWPWKINPSEPKDRYQIYIAKNKEREIVQQCVDIRFEAPRQMFLREDPADNEFNNCDWGFSDDNGGF